MLIGLFVDKISHFSSSFFGHGEKLLDKKAKFNLKFMISHTGE